MKIKSKKTRNGEYVKFIFEDMEDYRLFRSFICGIDKDGDTKGVQEFLSLMDDILNPKDSYEEDCPTVTIWQNRMHYLAVAFADIVILHQVNMNRMLDEKLAILKEDNKTLEEHNETLRKYNETLKTQKEFLRHFFPQTDEEDHPDQQDT